MIELQNQLISEAKAKYGEIFPCGEKTTIQECFTYEKDLGKLVFWFNVAADKSTRALTLAVKEA